jgi:hypothetical protein
MVHCGGGELSALLNEAAAADALAVGAGGFLAAIVPASTSTLASPTPTDITIYLENGAVVSYDGFTREISVQPSGLPTTVENGLVTSQNSNGSVTVTDPSDGTSVTLGPPGPMTTPSDTGGGGGGGGIQIGGGEEKED